MAKRIILVSSFPVFIGFVLLVLIFALRLKASAQFSQMASEQAIIVQENIDKAGQNIISLIETGHYSASESATETLIEDCPENPNLSKFLYSLAEKYDYAQRFEEAKRVYQQIAEKYPEYSYTEIGIAREEVLSLIYSRKYDEAKKNSDNLIADFEENPDFLNTLYWIAERYKWSKRYEEANDLYLRIIQKSTDSLWGQKAKLGLALTDVFSLIESQDYDKADQAVEGLILDFKENQDLPEVLYWIADKYRWSDNRLEEANGLYEQIARMYPDGQWFEKARLGISKTEVLSFIVAQDYNQADEALDKMIADFNGHPLLPEAVFNIADEYYTEAFNDKNPAGQEQKPEVIDKFQRATAVFERIIAELPESYPYTADAYYFTAECYYNSSPDSNNYETAIYYFEKVLDEWPDYKHACNAMGLMGVCYDRLRNKGTLRDDEADTLVEQTYQSLIEQYFDSDNAFVGYACIILAEMNFKKGQWVDSAYYYDSFLQKSRNGDPRAPDVLYNLSKAYEKMGESELAEQTYRSFLEKASPNDRRVEKIRQILEGQTSNDKSTDVNNIEKCGRI